MSNSISFFAGICLIASIFSRRFVDTVGEKILRKVKEATQEAKDASQNADEAKKSNQIQENLILQISGKLSEILLPLVEKIGEQDEKEQLKKNGTE